MKAVIVPVSKQLLWQLMPFPEGTTLGAAFVSDGHLNLVMTHDSMEEAHGHISVVSPQFKRVNDRIEFVTWGYPETVK